MNAIITQDPAALAKRINTAHREAKEYAAKAIERAIEAGDLLLEVKATLKHGEWLPWLAKHCPDIGTRTAQQYMRVARELPDEMRSAAHLSIRDALKALEAPSAAAESTESEKLAEWMTTAPLFDGLHYTAIWLSEADGLEPERIAERITSSYRRDGIEANYTAADIEATLSPPLPVRTLAKRDKDETGLSARDKEVLSAQPLYARAAAWEIAQTQALRIGLAQDHARIIGCPGLVARLDSIRRTLVRGTKPIQPPQNLGEQACIAAGILDGGLATSDETPWDAGYFPVALYAVATLHTILSDSDADLNVENDRWSTRLQIIRHAHLPIPIDLHALEKLALYRAYLVAEHFLVAEYSHLLAAAAGQEGDR